MINRKLPHQLAAMLACCTLAFVTTARAEEPAGESRAPSKAALKKYDADHDGKLSDEEKAKAKADAEARREVRKKEALEKYDADHDGKLDREEKGKMKEDKAAAKEARKAEREAHKAEKSAESDGK